MLFVRLLRVNLIVTPCDPCWNMKTYSSRRLIKLIEKLMNILK